MLAACSLGYEVPQENMAAILPFDPFGSKTTFEEKGKQAFFHY